MALEWADENEGRDFPQSLVDKLTTGLFEVPEHVRRTMHPSEDLMELLLKLSNGTKVQVGNAELTLGRRGSARLAKKLGEQREL